MIAVFPCLAPAGTVVPELDGVYHLLNILVLKDKRHRTLEVNILQGVFRAVYYFVCLVDICRAICIGFLCIIIAVHRVIQILTFLSSYRGRLSFLIRSYSSLLIVFETVREELETLVYYLLYGVFWAVVILAWMLVKCSLEQLSPIMYTFICCVFVALLAVLAIITPPLYLVASLGVSCLQNQQTRANLLVANGKSINTRVDKLRLKAVKPLVIRYGTFYRINRGFCVDFALTLAVRTCDAVLTFNP